MDKFGVSWQAPPTILMDYMRDPNPVKAKRVVHTMMQMGKLDFAPLHAAYNQS